MITTWLTWRRHTCGTLHFRPASPETHYLEFPLNGLRAPRRLTQRQHSYLHPLHGHVLCSDVISSIADQSCSCDETDTASFLGTVYREKPGVTVGLERTIALLHYYNVMRYLTTGIRSEKCVVRRFHRCANVTECT
jgi:hypothetical protein